MNMNNKFTGMNVTTHHTTKPPTTKNLQNSTQGKSNEQCDNNNRIGKEATNCIVATYKIKTKTKNKELTTNTKQNKAKT